MIRFKGDVQDAASGRTYLFSLGQAGFVVKSASGQLLGIDLYLSECVERVEGHVGYKRLLPQLLDPAELAFDAIVTTHFHRDHFDLDAVPALMENGTTQLYAAYDCRDDVTALELPEDRVSFVKPGDSCDCGDFHLDFINCDHGSGAPLAVGVIVTVDGKRILEVGDSRLRTDRVDEYLSAGPIDVMIAPINGAYGNLNEEECAALAGLLRPGVTIPCHYGMFASHGGNPGVFHDMMSERKLPYLLMAQGERYTLQGNTF